MYTVLQVDESTDREAPLRVLVADDSADGGTRVAELAGSRAEVVSVESGRAALDRLAAEAFDLCLIDLSLPTPGPVEIAHEVRRLRLPIRVVTTGPPSIEEAVRAIRAGADDYLPKPLDADRLHRLLAETARGRGTRGPDRFHGIVSSNPRMHAIFTLVEDIGPTTTTVLIQGETGTGKEELARAIHAASVGRGGPFVAVNCAAVPGTLMESEFFGHEQGSFTGADRQKIGKFETAHGGTLFLDEVGDVPPMMQVKLLRVLQERRFERVGGNDQVHVDVRVIAATNRPLRKMVRLGQFREDLYYRLNVVRIDVPPLRARADDIPALAAHFCRKYARPGTPPKRLSPAVVERLMRYPWPGNIRELENAIERTSVIHVGSVIEPHHLPPELTRADAAAAIDLGRPLKDVLRDATTRLEKRYIIRALKKTRGHVSRAAELCGYCRRSLTAKIAEYGIDRLAYAGRR